MPVTILNLVVAINTIKELIRHYTIMRLKSFLTKIICPLLTPYTRNPYVSNLHNYLLIVEIELCAKWGSPPYAETPTPSRWYTPIRHTGTI